MKVLNDIACNLNWIEILNLNAIHWIGFWFNWIEMGCKFVKKYWNFIFNYAVEKEIWEKPNLKRHLIFHEYF
jgi:hypothetical protein